MAVSNRQQQLAEQEKQKKIQFEASFAIVLSRFINKVKKGILRGQLNLNAYQSDLKTILSSFYSKVQNNFSKQTQKQLKVDLDDMSIDQLNNMLNNWGGARAILIGGQLIRTMQAKLNELSAQDLTPKQMATLWGTQTKVRASTTIAVTETQSSAENSKQTTAVMAATLVNRTAKKTWVTVGDEKVRPWHREAQGQSVFLNQKFTVGPDKLKYPGDPEGSLPNIINCRCSSVVFF